MFSYLFGPLREISIWHIIVRPFSSCRWCGPCGGWGRSRACFRYIRLILFSGFCKIKGVKDLFSNHLNIINETCWHILNYDIIPLVCFSTSYSSVLDWALAKWSKPPSAAINRRNTIMTISIWLTFCSWTLGMATHARINVRSPISWNVNEYWKVWSCEDFF